MGKLYELIYADPPWKFKTFSEKGMSRAADNHYDCMSIEDIKSLEVPAAKDCVLFLWTTSPFLRIAMDVIEAWEFQYKSELVWDKRVQGTGYYSRSVHEPLLIAIKGSPVAPPPEQRFESLIVERKRQHSRKPDEAYRRIEAMYPDKTKLEMFARCQRPGWDAWGNETDKFGRAAA